MKIFLLEKIMPPTKFSQEEESMLIEYVKHAANLQYGLTLKKACELAYRFAVENKKAYPPSWDVNQRAGDFWLRLFRKKYKNDVALRKPEATSLARSTAFNRTNVKLTFKNYKAALEKCPPLPSTNIWNCHKHIRPPGQHHYSLHDSMLNN